MVVQVHGRQVRLTTREVMPYHLLYPTRPNVRLYTSARRGPVLGIVTWAMATCLAPSMVPWHGSLLVIVMVPLVPRYHPLRTRVMMPPLYCARMSRRNQVQPRRNLVHMVHQLIVRVYTYKVQNPVPVLKLVVRTMELAAAMEVVD